jgi:8-oxo-dGTP diphosphatase
MKRILKYAVIIEKNGKILLQKEAKQKLLLLPGGKPHTGETPQHCITREIQEELKADIDASSLRYLGKFEDIAADGTSIVTVELYTGQLATPPKTTSVVRKLVWFGKNSRQEVLSPVIRNKILPYLTVVRILK